ncbi:MAG: hypothetical protein KGI71_06160 [Patescibacteria group bacterium]|nr:hypothetical protein [Patescibacteria group bacterium]
MKRSTFFATFLGALGIARAQQWRYPKADHQHDYLGRQLTIDLQADGVALNNQCPVCGTMAEPLKRVIGSYSYEPASGGLIALKPNYVDPGPGIVRCKRCNAAFWQDAEDR